MKVAVADIDECAVGNGKCQHGCHNVDGSHYCACRPGFVLTTRYNCTGEARSTFAVTHKQTEGTLPSEHLRLRASWWHEY